MNVTIGTVLNGTTANIRRYHRCVRGAILIYHPIRCQPTGVSCKISPSFIHCVRSSNYVLLLQDTFSE